MPTGRKHTNLRMRQSSVPNGYISHCKLINQQEDLLVSVRLDNISSSRRGLHPRMLTWLESPGITPLHFLGQNIGTRVTVKPLPSDLEMKKSLSTNLKDSLGLSKVSDKVVRKTVLLSCL